MSVTRHIGTRALLFTAIAGIMGSGWLFGPYFVAKMVGPAAIISWVIGGILMMLIAMTFAELSSAFPMTGGSVRFLQLSHGPLVSFTMAWIGWLSATAVAPIETMALLHYINNFIPGLMNQVGTTFVLSKFGFFDCRYINVCHGCYKCSWR